MRPPRSDAPGLAPLLLAAWLAGCAPAMRSSAPAHEAGESVPSGALAPDRLERARAQLAIGRSTQEDVRTALGPAAAELAFESGYAVWVYRLPSQEPASRALGELVLLFGPSGTLAKARLRPPQE